jgi:hypothetical protein
VSRVQQDQSDAAGRRLAPDQFAARLASWDQQLLVVAEGHDLTDRFYPQEGGKEQINPALDFTVGMLGDRARRVADQADGEGQGQLAPRGFVEQTGGQACANGMQLQFRYQPLKT